MQEIAPAVLKLEKLWTCQDLADYHGVTVQTVRIAIRSGDIPGCTKSGKSYAIDRDLAIAGWDPKSKVQAARASVSVKVPVTKESEQKYLKALSDEVPVEAWQRIVRKAVIQAEAGDRHARKWLTDNLVGPPVKRTVVAAEVTSTQEFSDSERAAVVTTLIELANERSAQLAEPNTDGKAPDGQSSQERPALDAAPGEHTSD